MSGETYRGTFLGSISPWGVSRSQTPQQAITHGNDPGVLQRSQGEDHTVTHRHRISLHRYPKDCPPLKVRWFYAVDSPKWKPALFDKESHETKQLAPPKKFVPFSNKDSEAIETTFQRFSELEFGGENSRHGEDHDCGRSTSTKVPVNEDYLFDVDVDRRELGPAYWKGPIYEVRRGTWFFQDGSTIKPCEENLATQLEEGYLKVKPWRTPKGQLQPHPSQHSSTLPADDQNTSAINSNTVSDSSGPNELNSSAYHKDNANMSPTPANQSQSYRLFGAYMNSIATYQDSSKALLANDDFMSRVSTTVYQKLGGVPGTKVVRGFNDARKQKEPASNNIARKLDTGSPSGFPGTVPTGSQDKAQTDTLKSSTAHGQSPGNQGISDKSPRSTLERQMSSLAGEPQNRDELEEQARRQEEKEMEDSREIDNEDREREVDHLILVTHGIGQRLGLRLESINFIHDVNVLRKTMKGVYLASPGLQELNSSYADKHKNCRVQVLPVSWRHLLDFPHHGVRQNRKELDLTDADVLDSDLYPSLADITLDSVPSVRNLISDLAMDVLLYQSAYCEHISTIVKDECNRIVKLYKERNPSFQGSVSLCGHSLGSAILFDILCHQDHNLSSTKQDSGADTSTGQQEASSSRSFDFNCEEFFCLGSPIALFQMLKGKTISGRRSVYPSSQPSASTRHPAYPSTGFLNDSRSIVSSPNCGQLYNIFHPSDPVSYRMEPLISPEMSSLKPQPLPSVKKSLWTASGESLSVFGNRVGQSVGSLWNNLTSGVASGLLNRGLSLNLGEDSQQQSYIGSESQQAPTSGSAGLDSPGGSDDIGRHTVLNPAMETLFNGTPGLKDRLGKNQSQPIGPESGDYEHTQHEMKLKAEDEKVRSLNSNGRVDYSIQEGAFDISLIASIASHLTYWADEDVNHFMLSQMLSRRNSRPRQ
ncbi:phosphatidic acid-preferring phospholipase A1 [Aspergillus campestris IBT 28561]|uniref:Phosphatidic acid-preferring phospholipase A1 n=1 Tax=Aspergillus campestris (strain IBT 28561) TaxID=1392248 RepID=A0A2I1D635_ASPC2|nr:phosphatidic acid-preferring phospholipase A1 [Aspergillus campestris IBT 28561]PKY05335.1 phosphatidic acid-preferring phospholipase A1 [Aspergillus campestris IBT 28561]